jgi:eukaryotic-like serine/threonine-protein kinase
MTYIKPKRFGKYLIIEPIKTEKPIQEFKAVDITGNIFSRFYKIKMIHPDCMGDQDALKMLIFEAKLNQELNHPNIAAFIDAGKMNGRPYFVEEYIWGKSLLQFFRKLRDKKKLMGHQHAAHIASEVSRALAHAHNVKLDWAGDRPVIHQNLNPRNIIISFDGRVSVIDFGISPVNLLSGSLAEYDFRRLGYLSPEQANRLGVDFRTDVFTTGTLLYEMITGYPCFLEKNAKKVLKRIRIDGFKPPEQIAPNVPKDLSAIVMKAMSEDRDSRFKSMVHFEKLLDGYIDKTDPSFVPDNLGNLMKGLFLGEIKKEIKTHYEIFKNSRDEGAKVLKSIPIILFNLVKAKPLQAAPAANKKPRYQKKTQSPLTTPTKPAILRPVAPAAFDDEATIMDNDYFRSRIKSTSKPAFDFSDEATRILMENTDPVMFESEETILFDDEKYDVVDNQLIQENLQKKAMDERSLTGRSKIGRSPTGYFKKVERNSLPPNLKKATDYPSLPDLEKDVGKGELPSKNSYKWPILIFSTSIVLVIILYFIMT